MIYQQKKGGEFNCHKFINILSQKKKDHKYSSSN